MENTTTMTISAKNQALQAIAHPDSDRLAISGVHFNSKHVVATDGHKMIIARKAEGEPENCNIQFDSAKQAGSKTDREFYQPLTTSTYKLVGSHSTSNVATVLEQNDYPDYTCVLPRKDAHYNLSFGINAEYLMQIAKALNYGQNKNKLGYVTLQLEVDIKECGDDKRLPAICSSILVSGVRDDAVGIVMPMRTESEPLPILNKLRA